VISCPTPPRACGARNASTQWRNKSGKLCGDLRNVFRRAAEHSACCPLFRNSVPVIGKITAPRGERVEGLIYDLFGPGRSEEDEVPVSWSRSSGFRSLA
jgi:hypothetical protein